MENLELKISSLDFPLHGHLVKPVNLRIGAAFFGAPPISIVQTLKQRPIPDDIS